MRVFLPLALFALATTATAQMPTEQPGKADPARVTGGTYTVDTNHTLVVWVVNHLGFNDYVGLFGGITGTLALDKANAANDKLSIDIPISGLTTVNPKLNAHLSSKDFFDVAQFATAHFESTKVVAQGDKARIYGNLTLHGVTKPITLDARFHGAGTNFMSKRETIGFGAQTVLKRSEFGMGYFVPLVSDDVDIKITAAFEKN